MSQRPLFLCSSPKGKSSRIRRLAHKDNTPHLFRNAITAIIRGKVQGVFFRDFAARHAQALGLSGYAANGNDGTSVEVYAEGEEDALQRLVQLLSEGPPRARVDNVEVLWCKPSDKYHHFQIRW